MGAGEGGRDFVPAPSPSSIFVFALHLTWESVHRLCYAAKVKLKVKREQI